MRRMEAVFMEYLKNQPEFVIFGPGSANYCQTDERMGIVNWSCQKR